MAQAFRPGVGNIALFTEGKLKKKIQLYSPAGSGEVNTAANVGQGTGIFYQKSNTELEFKSLTEGSHISIADNGSGTVTISAEIENDDVGWYQNGNQNIESSGSVAITGSFTSKGGATLGDAGADVITVTGQLTGSSGGYFNGNVGIGTAPDGNYGLVLPNNATTGQIKATSYITYSDKTLKMDIKPIHRAIDKVKLMRGVTYKSHQNGSAEIGLIAQEVHKIVPEIVDATGGLMGIDYSRLTPILIEALKEQQKQIDALKKELKGISK